MKRKIAPNEMWQSPAVMIAAASAVLSLFSLAVSVRSCSVSDHGFDLVSRDFAGARSIVLMATLDEKKNEFIFAPTNPDIQLQQAIVFLPPQLDKHEWRVSLPDLRFPLTVLQYELQKLTVENVPKKRGFVKFLSEANVPTIIDSQFIAKGEPRRDRSLYVIRFTALVSDEENEDAKITFKGVMFLERLSLNRDPRSTLASLWDQGLQRVPTQSSSAN